MVGSVGEASEGHYPIVPDWQLINLGCDIGTSARGENSRLTSKKIVLWVWNFIEKFPLKGPEKLKLTSDFVRGFGSSAPCGINLPSGQKVLKKWLTPLLSLSRGFQRMKYRPSTNKDLPKTSYSYMYSVKKTFYPNLHRHFFFIFYFKGEFFLIIH